MPVRQHAAGRAEPAEPTDELAVGCPERVALVAITRGGARLAATAARALPGATVYVPAHWQPEAGPDARPLPGSVSGEVGRLFAVHDGLVVFAAVGVVVRLIAPHLRGKTADPGVVAVDDAGRYAVSVLSGHLGGGNVLARRIGVILGAQPIITTASEAHGLPAIDLLGQRWGWRVENVDAAKRVSAALVNGEPVGAVQEAGEAGWWPAEAPRLVRFESVAALASSGLQGIVVTDRLLPEPADGWVIVRPRSLVLGVGASTGVAADEIEALGRATVAGAGLAWSSLALVATLDRKVGEPGIVAFATRHGLLLRGYAASELAGVPVPHPSDVVQRHVGTASVCEAAAVLAANGGPLLGAKRKSDRATVAVARRVLPASVAGGSAPAGAS